MNSISYLLALALGASAVSGSSLGSNPSAIVQTLPQSFQYGNEVVKTARADYQAGKYAEFLEQMDKDYQNAKKENGLEGLIEIRKETAKVEIDPEFAKSSRQITDTRNQDLLDAVKGSDTPFSAKVRMAASKMPDLDSNLISLFGKTPGIGKNGDENKIIDLDLEYYYKAIHLDSEAASGSVSDRREKHMVLEMQKMDRMVEASKNFEDKKLAKSIHSASEVLDQRLARGYDLRDLNNLANGKVKPTSAEEEKVASIFSNAQSQLAELHFHLLNVLDMADAEKK